MRDVRIEIKVRNNLILRKMEEKSISSVAQLSRELKSAGLPVSQSVLGTLINMKQVPFDKRDSWRIPVARMAEFFNCLPEDLFSYRQQNTALAENKAKAEIEFATFERLAAAPSPEVEFNRNEFLGILSDVLSDLPARCERVLRLRFGIDGEEKTLDEVAVEFGVHRERIRQLEAKGLRLLKQPKRSKQLRPYLDGFDA